MSRTGRLSWTACLACLAAAVICLTGCGREEKVEVPDPEVLKRFLDGRRITVGDTRLRIEKNGISRFVIEDAALGPEGRTLCADVGFTYSTGRRKYDIRGVLSCKRGPSGVLESPVFEVTD